MDHLSSTLSRWSIRWQLARSIQTPQWVNRASGEVGGATVGESLRHEINEAYIRAQMFPGQTFHDPKYQIAHAQAFAHDSAQARVLKVHDCSFHRTIIIRFSTTEALVADSKKQTVFLGVSARQGTPLNLISYGRAPMITINPQITIGKDGNFTGVISGEEATLSRSGINNLST